MSTFVIVNSLIWFTWPLCSLFGTKRQELFVLFPVPFLVLGPKLVLSICWLNDSVVGVNHAFLLCVNTTFFLLGFGFQDGSCAFPPPFFLKKKDCIPSARMNWKDLVPGYPDVVTVFLFVCFPPLKLVYCRYYFAISQDYNSRMHSRNNQVLMNYCVKFALCFILVSSENKTEGTWSTRS